MMFIEIPLDHLRRLYTFVTLGKLMNGLVHNLNGPLQNLGMDLEMLIYSPPELEPSRKDLMKGMGSRLRRMDGELDTINHLIKTTAMKADREDGYLESMKLNEFLEQELYFWEANLYFKHNVRRQLDLEDDLPLTNTLPEGATSSLCWFIEALVEEMEKEKVKTLTLKAKAVDGEIKILFKAGEGRFSDGFVGKLDFPLPASGSVRIQDGHLGLILAVALLKSTGVSVTGQNGPSGTDIALGIPLRAATHVP